MHRVRQRSATILTVTGATRNPMGEPARTSESSDDRKDFGIQLGGLSCNLSGMRSVIKGRNMDRAGFVQSRFRFEATGGHQPPQTPNEVKGS